MKTLQEDIDDLDRMVDGGAQKDAIRSQIRLIAREVAALEADYARAVEHDSQTTDTLMQLQNEYAVFKEAQSRKDAEAWQEMARDSYIEPTYGAE